MFPSADITVQIHKQESDSFRSCLMIFNVVTSRVNSFFLPLIICSTRHTPFKDIFSIHQNPDISNNVHAEENNDNQAEFTNPFCTPVHKHAESSSCNIVGTIHIGDSVSKGSGFELTAFSDADHAGCLDYSQKHFWRNTVPSYVDADTASKIMALNLQTKYACIAILGSAIAILRQPRAALPLPSTSIIGLISIKETVHKLLTRVLRIILVIVPEHPSDTYVLTMKMEILLEPASNKLLLNMGNGESTTFWEDRWLEGSVLKDIFPRLYVLETNKKVSVGDKLKDFRYVWSLSNSGDFSVASFRKVIDENRYPGGRSRTRWVKYVPIKVNVTAWKIKMDALPTRLNISRRGMDIQSLSCPICDCGVESSSHLFFQCNLDSIVSSFRRQVRGGAENSQFAQLQELVGTTILSNSVDRWYWDHNGSGEFCVKDVRNLLDAHFLPKEDHATSRDVTVSSSSCPVCDSAPEDLSHLLFSCSMASDVYRLVCR
ncbi:RNA-directed DNA polymerase, eukaryota [Tanacetum coccineum]